MRTRPQPHPVRPPAPHPPYGPEHEAFRDEVRAVVAAELRPHAERWEAAGWFDHEAFTSLAAHGLLGLKYPERHGGRDLGPLHDAILTEELARCGSGGTAAGIGAHIGIATPPIWKFGTEEQLDRWLAPAVRADKIAALAITEPDAGSDVAGLRTRARRVDGGWVVDGAKTYITNGARADVVVCAVRTGADPASRHAGVSFLVLERGMPGFTVGRRLDKLGWRASDTAELHFEEVWVPPENLLGREHEGFKLIMANFAWERLLMALGAVGAMEWALERARPLVPARRWAAFAELALTAQAARAITGHALRRYVSGEPSVAEVTQAKLVTQRAAVEVAAACLALHADAGSPEQADAERALRDARLGPIGGGTDEIMREILGKTLGA